MLQSRWLAKNFISFFIFRTMELVGLILKELWRIEFTTSEMTEPRDLDPALYSASVTAPHGSWFMIKKISEPTPLSRKAAAPPSKKAATTPSKKAATRPSTKAAAKTSRGRK